MWTTDCLYSQEEHIILWCQVRSKLLNTQHCSERISSKSRSHVIAFFIERECSKQVVNMNYGKYVYSLTFANQFEKVDENLKHLVANVPGDALNHSLKCRFGRQ